MQTSSNPLPPYFLPLFPVVFFGVWALVGLLISSLSGWWVLASRFSTDEQPFGEVKTAGPLFYGIYLRFWTHYSSVVRITAAHDALYLSVLFLFRIGHPPLRIPWNEIQFSTTTYFLRRYMVLTLGTNEQIPLRISQRMARNLGLTERFSAPSAPIE
ncbi:MAG: hypothetical protein KGL64_12710 [Acidobacteriota bacterium]|nr:hypothetical protein [Acidobacteriota bacterium]